MFLEYTEYNFLLQVLEKPLGTCPVLDLPLTNRVVGKVKLKASLGSSDHGFRSLRAGRRGHSKVWPGLEESRLRSLQETARWNAVG